MVRRVVTIGSPHHGTSLAELAGSISPGLCPLACQQLAPTSTVLASLNSRDETPDGASWLSVWRTNDEVVTPPSSARLTGAINVPVQSVCANVAVTHGRLPLDPLVIGLVRRALGVTPIVAPNAGDCAQLRQLGGG